ncbi:hypothetical protein F4678DRAFT_478113 [Xylaria arbuscula]|nr:hypothetical protein F4678DRAFT_478113 [Xylaria arbuscula]
MAYYTSIFQDAHKDPTIRNAVPEHTTYGSLPRYAETPHASIPFSRSPRSRPFAAFANSTPTPPPRRLGPPSAAEIAEEAAMARQRDLYAMPGAPMQPDFRRWNGRVISVPEQEEQEQKEKDEDGIPSLTSAGKVVVDSLMDTAHAVLGAAKAGFKRHGSAHAEHWRQFLFEISALRYNLVRSLRTAAVSGPLLLAMVFLFVVWQLGRVVRDDWETDLLHVLME